MSFQAIHPAGALRCRALSVAAVVLVSVFAGCGEETRVEFEGNRCSFDPDESPQLVCDLSRVDLICTNTYFKAETPVWVCRKGCRAATDCTQPSDVCCKGPLAGEFFDYERSCVPASLCQTDTTPLTRGSPAP